MTIQGGGFRPGATVAINFRSPGDPTSKVAIATAGAGGSFSVTVGVPLASTSGLHHFEAVGPAPDGHQKVQLTSIDVVGAPVLPGGRPLPQTAALVGIAVAIPVLTWLVLAVRARRPRRRA